MQERLFILYYLMLLTGIAVGIIRFRKLDRTLHWLLFQLAAIAVCELVAYCLFKAKMYRMRPAVYHVSSVLEMIFVSAYFLQLIRPPAYKLLMRCNVVLWPVTGILNLILLEHFDELNTNMLMLESFCIITMSLYTVYHMLKHDPYGQYYNRAHLWICLLWLLMWSSTFFFWAFVKVLNSARWPYMELVLQLQIVACIVVYGGIALVLLRYSPNRPYHEYN